MCIPSTCGITNEEAKHQMMMDERERENDATFQDHNTHTHIQRGPKWNSDDPPTIPHFLSSVWVWSRYTMVEIVLVVQWISITSHHTWILGSNSHQLKKSNDWSSTLSTYLVRVVVVITVYGMDETRRRCGCFVLVNSVMGEASDEPCSLRMYIYIYKCNDIVC